MQTIAEKDLTTLRNGFIELKHVKGGLCAKRYKTRL